MKTAGKDTRRALGSEGERLASDFLIAKGMRLIAHNWRCRTGELDLIADENGTLVIVEVRTRRGTGSFGTPEESVNVRKQLQVRETAAVYLQRSKAYERKIRFDVVAVQFRGAGESPEIRHVENAF